MGVLAGLLVVALLAGTAFATAASAETFKVNVPGDEQEEEGCIASNPCALRDAIERANENPGADTIEFGISGTIAIEGFPLPRIEEAVTIDATTAPGYGGTPVVEIDGSEARNEGPVRGLEIFAGPTIVEGLAIGGFFGEAIYAEAAQPVQVCGDYLGTDLTGAEARPDYIGVEVGRESTGAEIGANCPGGVGNLISGNEYFGILDRGQGTEVAANRIGLDASGGPLGNGGYEEDRGPEGGGIYITGEARNAFVGPAAKEAGNTIAFNEIAGVRVSAEAELATIGENSIHSNVGPGIEYEGEPTPVVPSLGSAEGRSAETSVSGGLEGKAGEAFFVEFFANQACDESGAGEGQTPIGGLVVTADPAGKVNFTAHGLDPLPAGQAVVTATATAESGSTSEFSKCVTATLIPPEEKKPPPPEVVLPVNGESVEVEPESGTILVQFPGQKKPHPLRKGEIIPVGTIVDATNGRVTLTSIDDEGHEQTAVFYGGKFQVFQQPGSTVVVLRLRGDGPGTGACKGAGGVGGEGRTSATISRRRGRHLWGSGHGSFRTEGAHGSATVRGTIWFTEDRCDGTYFKTKSGIVTVRDFTKHRSVQVPAGREYLAKTP
jgi:hypothetical protein